MTFFPLSPDGAQRVHTEPLLRASVRVVLEPRGRGIDLLALEAAGVRLIGRLDGEVAESYRRVLEPLAALGAYGVCFAEPVAGSTVLRLAPARRCVPSSSLPWLPDDAGVIGRPQRVPSDSGSAPTATRRTASGPARSRGRRTGRAVLTGTLLGAAALGATALATLDVGDSGPGPVAAADQDPRRRGPAPVDEPSVVGWNPTPLSTQPSAIAHPTGPGAASPSVPRLPAASGGGPSAVIPVPVAAIQDAPPGSAADGRSDGQSEKVDRGHPASPQHHDQGAGTDRSGGHSGDDRPDADRTGNDRPDADRPGNDRPGNDRPGKDRPGNDRPGNDRPGNDRPGNDRPGKDRPGNDRPGNDRPGNDRPGNDRPGKDRPGNDRPGKDRPGNDRHDRDRDKRERGGSDERRPDRWKDGSGRDSADASSAPRRSESGANPSRPRRHR